MDATVHSSSVSSDPSGSADYRKKRIKNVQKLELVRLMKANFLFIRGKHAVARCEKSRTDVWKMITARLNNLGPPVQSAEAWQRRWNDMRSATKSKMAKIQNFVREHGEECPYKLNLVERLIWETFSVKPEEYIKDLNMKLWREKRQTQQCSRLELLTSAAPSVDGESVSSADVSLEHGFEMGRINAESTATNAHHRDSNEIAPLSNFSCGRAGSHQMATPESCAISHDGFHPQLPTAMGFGPYHHGVCTTSTPMNGRNVDEIGQWHHTGSSSGERQDNCSFLSQQQTPSPTDLVHGSNRILRDLNKLFDLVLRQNEEILDMLRQSSCEH